MNLLDKISIIYNRICRTLFGIATALLLVIFVLINFDVVKRMLGLGSTLWVLDISIYSLLVIVFLGATWVLIKDKHIKIDLITSKLKPIPKAIIELFSSTLSAGVSLIIIWYSAKLTLDYFHQHYMTSGMLEIPAFILYIWIPIGFFFLFLQFARTAFSQIKILRHVTRSDKY